MVDRYVNVNWTPRNFGPYYAAGMCVWSSDVNYMEMYLTDDHGDLYLLKRDHFDQINHFCQRCDNDFYKERK